MKIFIAIDFDKETKEYLCQTEEKIKALSTRGLFTFENNLHLNVKYLGDVDSYDLPSVIGAINEAAYKTKKFTISLSHLGFFPKGRKSIVWAGINKSTGFEFLFKNLERSLEKQGFQKERKSNIPHITLGREVELKKTFDEIKKLVPIENREIAVNSITLYESKIIGKNLVYYPLEVINLK